MFVASDSVLHDILKLSGGNDAHIFLLKVYYWIRHFRTGALSTERRWASPPCHNLWQGEYLPSPTIITGCWQLHCMREHYRSFLGSILYFLCSDQNFQALAKFRIDKMVISELHQQLPKLSSPPARPLSRRCNQECAEWTAPHYTRKGHLHWPPKLWRWAFLAHGTQHKVTLGLIQNNIKRHLSHHTFLVQIIPNWPNKDERPRDLQWTKPEYAVGKWKNGWMN